MAARFNNYQLLYRTLMHLLKREEKIVFLGEDVDNYESRTCSGQRALLMQNFTAMQ
jgi:pyruvate/2-oxoglutarate/acetoin dehydrogenase E1 component